MYFLDIFIYFILIGFEILGGVIGFGKLIEVDFYKNSCGEIIICVGFRFFGVVVLGFFKCL